MAHQLENIVYMVRFIILELQLLVTTSLSQKTVIPPHSARVARAAQRGAE